MKTIHKNSCFFSQFCLKTVTSSKYNINSSYTDLVPKEWVLLPSLHHR